jgi:hypothetical protein
MAPRYSLLVGFGKRSQRPRIMVKDSRSRDRDTLGPWTIDVEQTGRSRPGTVVELETGDSKMISLQAIRQSLCSVTTKCNGRRG